MFGVLVLVSVEVSSKVFSLRGSYLLCVAVGTGWKDTM